MTVPDSLADFERHRSFLAGLAYRMLGSVAEAEDVVQDAYLRWREVDRAAIEEPRAYLARVVSRLCLDHLKSASHRREQYVGTWLPAFLLHDVFDMDYPAVAAAIERGEAACRQLVTRAREHVRQDRPRYVPSDAEARRLADAFVTAAATGDVNGLARLLAEDAVWYSDGGGKRVSALKPVVGKDRIVRFYEGILAKGSSAFSAVRAEPVTLNGLPGFVFQTADGIETLAVETANDLVVALYAVRNPDKVRHLA